MDGLNELITSAQTEQLPALRAQRRLLLGLIADIRDVQGWLTTLDASEFWNSRAQRAYSHLVAEIADELHHVLQYLNEAQDQIRHNIRRLEAQQ